MSDVRRALDALEKILDVIGEPDNDHITSVYYETILEVREIATRALLPRKQEPPQFTRADVSALRHMVDAYRRIFGSGPELVARLADISDRIEALLPPVDTE